MKIIINGKCGSGKDVVADYLVKKYGFKKLFFAEPIYQIARELFGMTSKDRGLLQAIGQKMREIDKDVWVNYTYKIADNYENVVISDCRQANEFLAGSIRNYIPIKIVSDLDKRIERLTQRDGFSPDTSLFENECETGADNYEYLVFENNGTLEELFEKIDWLVSEGEI